MLLVQPGQYEILTTKTVLGFAAPYLPEPPTAAQEIGDGNINNVFRVSSPAGSVIVKQALPYMRLVGDGWPLTRHRAGIEARALAVHAKLAPLLLPEVLGYDEDLSALVLEDLCTYTSWREDLLAGRLTDGVAGSVGSYSAQVLFGTSGMVLAPAEHKALKRGFAYSDLTALTEDLVFTAPYIDAPSNRYDDEIADIVDSLHHDPALLMAAAELRSDFRTHAEALVHGDLHSGSVMVSGASAKVIDLEFAFFGPIGLDPGMLLANLALSRLARESVADYEMCRHIDQCAEQYWSSFVDESRRLWPPAEPWRERFLARVLSATARFAGAEMIRRVVGLAHVKDIDMLPGKQRHRAQSRALASGRALILRQPVNTFGELWELATGFDPYG